jgi:hypothetical protein
MSKILYAESTISIEIGTCKFLDTKKRLCSQVSVCFVYYMLITDSNRCPIAAAKTIKSQISPEMIQILERWQEGNGVRSTSKTASSAYGGQVDGREANRFLMGFPRSY